MLEQALARMLDLGYGVKQSELALFRAGGDINLAIEELQAAGGRPPRSRTEPEGPVDLRNWSALRAGPRPRVQRVAARRRNTVGRIQTRMRMTHAAHTAAHGVMLIQDMRHDSRAHHHAAQVSADDTDFVAQAAKRAEAKKRDKALEEQRWARGRRHAAMRVKGPSVRELNATLRRRAAAARPDAAHPSRGVREELHSSKGQFTGSQLSKMDAAADLLSSYLPPDHPVLERMTQTLDGDGIPLPPTGGEEGDDEADELWSPPAPEPEPEPRQQTGDTSDDDDEDGDRSGSPHEGGEVSDAAREIAALDPALYYRQSSSRLAAALEAKRRMAAQNRRPRPATAPARRSTRTAEGARGGFSVSPGDALQTARAPRPATAGPRSSGKGGFGSTGALLVFVCSLWLVDLTQCACRTLALDPILGCSPLQDVSSQAECLPCSTAKHL